MAADSVKWDHDQLAADLASHLRGGTGRIVWTDMQLGPVGSARPDVYTIDRSFAHPRPTAYEVKVSVADFRVDVTAGKWQAYLHHAECVHFAVPAGLVSREDIPKGCGLLVRGEAGWRAVRGATRQVVKVPETTWLKLLIDGIDRDADRRAYKGTALRAARFQHAAMDKHLGADVAAAVRDLQGVRAQITALEQRAAAEEEHIAERRAKANRDLEDALRPLAVALGLPPDVAAWQVADECRRRAAQPDMARATRQREEVASQIVRCALQVKSLAQTWGGLQKTTDSG